MNIEDRVNKMSSDLERLVIRAEIWQILFDECPIAIAVFDSNMKFFLVNDEFLNLTGYATDILGSNIKEVIPLRHRRNHRKFEKQYVANPVRKLNRHGLSPEIVTKNNVNIPVDIDLSYIHYDSSTYYVAFIRRILN